MTVMNFNTTNSTFRQLLANGLTFRVPPFQRDYSWTEDEWDDLWQDLVGLFGEHAEPAHYMGYLVLQSSDNKQFDIIDGQQRITTISLMILAGLNHLQHLVDAGLDANHNAKRKEQLQNSYIGYLDPVTLISRPKLELNRHNNRFYQSYLVPLIKLPQRGLNASEHQLRKAFLWFQEHIQGHVGTTVTSGTELAVFFESLVDKLFFTVITVTDELNAFKVFETLNARGVRLSSTDLLKNYLFSVISAEHSHDIELKYLEEQWERIVGLLGSESFPEFLRVFWNSRHRLVRKSDLFKTIRRQILSRNEAFVLIRNLDQSAAVYAALRDPQDNLWNHEERWALEQLVMFNVRQPLAMLMACYERFYEIERMAFTRIVKAVAVVSFRGNVICNVPSSDQEKLYNEIASKVSSGTFETLTNVMTALRDVYPSDSQFRAAFSEKEMRTTNHRNKKIVRYILFEIERQRSGQSFDFENATYSLEHILPEHPSSAWSFLEESKQERAIYRLGNMTPLETGRNRDLSNGDYLSKRAVYQQSVFQITKAVAEHYEEWDERAIEARQKRLADVASAIWKIDFAD